jgi:hypothetical protein
VIARLEHKAWQTLGPNRRLISREVLELTSYRLKP